MKRPIEKGMILCAGLGTRLLPITQRYPKPLVPVLNVPNMLHQVALLRRNGVKEIIINLFHLPDRIEEYLVEHEIPGVKIAYSREEVLLGTGGGVKKAQKFFGDSPFILANCDFVTNADLSAAIANHQENESWATMVLLQDPERQSLYSPVGVDEEGQLCSLPRKETRKPERQGIFTGIHILEPEVFNYLEEKPSGINEVLYPTLMTKQSERVRGVFLKNAFWYDTGDLPAIWDASLKLLDQLKNPKSHLLEVLRSFIGDLIEKKPGIWCSPQTEVPGNVKLRGPALIGRGVHFAGEAEIGPYSILGDGVLVGEGSRIQNAIVLPQATLPPQTDCLKTIYFENQKLSVTG